MIDIENELFSDLAAILRAEYTGIFVTGEYVKAPPVFPAVSIVEVDNYALEKTQDSGSMENHAGIVYEINVYSNKASGKKAECKSIISTIDTRLLQIGFTRTALTPVPNLEESTIYRMTGRYAAAVSQNKTIYRR